MAVETLALVWPLQLSESFCIRDEEVFFHGLSQGTSTQQEL